MRQAKITSGLILRFLITAAWLLASLSVHAANGLPEFTNIVAENGSAVVNISTKKKSGGEQSSQGMPRGLPPGLQMPEGTPFDDLFKHFFPEDGQPGQGAEDDVERYQSHSLGSGFVLSSDGYILTNHHVIKGADEIIVRFDDRRELEAEVLGSDERSDVALLKVKASGLKAVRLGDSSKLQVGEWMLAIGSPFGFDATATAGIVSALGRSLPGDSYVPFIQTDVAINPGNSGGPLFNLDGEVVGINSQIYSRSGGFMGVSFAIPMDVVMDVVKQIKSQGYVSRGWLGVIIQNVTAELAESFGLDKPQGALIAKVLPDSPAEKAGLEEGDVILRFNGKEVGSSSELPPIVGRTAIDERVPVVVQRNGKMKTLRVKIEELPDSDELASTNSGSESKGDSQKTFAKRIGIGVANLTELQRNKLSIEAGGVRVIRMESGPAALAGIHQGDVILKLNNQKITGTSHFIEVVKSLPEGRSVPILVQRAGGTSFLALKIE